MRTALRAAIATAVLAGVAITPALTAGSAFAADGTTPAAGAAAAPAPEREHVRTDELLDGVTAEVYKTGKGSFVAEFFLGKQSLGSLTSGKKTVQGQFLRVGVEFFPDGSIVSVRTVDGLPQGEIILNRSFGQGLFVRVYTREPGRFVATITENGSHELTRLFADGGKEGRATVKGIEFVLHTDGSVTGKAVADGKGTLVRTEKLSDGTVVKIYKVGDFHHRAESFVNGHSIGVLDATSRPVAGQNNGSFLVLYPQGQTLHWTGNSVFGGKPGRYKLANGTVLELAKKNGRFGLQRIENGKGSGFFYVEGVRSVFHYDDEKTVVVIERDGSFSSYHVGGKKQGAPVFIGTGTGTSAGTAPAVPSDKAPQGSTSQTSVVPRGGVAAGAELGEDGADGTLIAAGAGAASLAAAGLGFVVLRRRAAGARG